ncbi:sigma factor [Streptomyces sp. NPDC060187]|uniref:sigma factor n=1 Tax=Streptomyces sp. NPDC060187 TaxID=3347067 RepID=UPI003651A06F
MPRAWMQETHLRTWRARDDCDPSRAALWIWLHRIANHACLTPLETRRCPLPAGCRVGRRSVDRPAGCSRSRRASRGA